MQDDSQEASATSSPDPLTLDGPQDRDIDVFQFLPNSAGSCEAYRQNQQDVFLAPRRFGFPEIALVLAISAVLLQKQRKSDSRAKGDSRGLVQPERLCYLGLPMAPRER
jgi:hypothetical protein